MKNRKKEKPQIHLTLSDGNTARVKVKGVKCHVFILSGSGIRSSCEGLLDRPGWGIFVRCEVKRSREFGKN